MKKHRFPIVPKVKSMEKGKYDGQVFELLARILDKHKKSGLRKSAILWPTKWGEATLTGLFVFLWEFVLLGIAEARSHRKACVQAITDELERWRSLGTLRRMPAAKARNVCVSRWVLKWTQVATSKREIKARLAPDSEWAATEMDEGLLHCPRPGV